MIKATEIPDIFINKTNFERLVRESTQYRKQRNRYALLALIGWSLAVTVLIWG
jgi:hypothetical protein